MNVFLAILITAMVSVALTVLVFKGPLPIIDNGSKIFTVPTEEARTALIEQILPKYGLRPRYQIKSSGIDRVFLNDWTIINIVTHEMSERMGYPVSGLAFMTRDPKSAAAADAEIWRDAGFDADVLGELDTELEPNRMTFLTTSAVPGIVFVYRRHVSKMGKKPSKYRKKLGK